MSFKMGVVFYLYLERDLHVEFILKDREQGTDYHSMPKGKPKAFKNGSPRPEKAYGKTIVQSKTNKIQFYF